MLCRFFGSLALVLAVATTATALPNERIRGVNLGGWLVLETWIKPSLFKGKWAWDEDGVWAFSDKSPDEYNYCKLLGKEEASKRLSEHWETWVTHDDIKTLAEAGINHFRVPVPYWIMGDIQEDEPYVTGNTPGLPGSSLYYLTRAVKWAKEYGVQVWFDLHAAPGSQNGFDNSGRAGKMLWDKNMENIERSVKVLGDLAKHFADEGLQDTMTGIGLLNEPEYGIDLDKVLMKFYADSFKAVRTHLPDVSIFIADSFGPERFNKVWQTGGPEGWDNNLGPPKEDDIKAKPFHRQLTSGLRGQQEEEENNSDSSAPLFNFRDLERKLESVDFDGHEDHPGSYHKSKGMVLLDTHVYHVFSDDLRMFPASRHIGRICLWDHVNINKCCWDGDKPTKLKRMIGEWTAAFDQRPSGDLEYREVLGKVHNMTEERAAYLKHFVYSQMAEYESRANLDPESDWHWQQIEGWFFWNFKMELETYREWDYLKGLERGWIPKLPTEDTDERVASEIFGTCEDQRQWVLNEGDKMKGVVDPYPEKWKFLDQYEDPDTAPTDDWMRHPEEEEEEESSFSFKPSVTVLAIVGVIVVALGMIFRRDESQDYEQIYGSDTQPLKSEISIPAFRSSNSN